MFGSRIKKAFLTTHLAHRQIINNELSEGQLRENGTVYVVFIPVMQYIFKQPTYPLINVILFNQSILY
jgi:hypothetical protein